MVKRLSTLVVAGLLALPTVALAQDDLEDRIAALEEKQESWDLASRIQWNGDFRFRMDYLSADAPAQYSAGAVAQNMAAIAPGFGITSSQQLVAMLPTLFTMPGFDTAAGRQLALGTADVPATDYENDTVYTNRFRLNMRAQVMENLEFKARLAMYKGGGRADADLRIPPRAGRAPRELRRG
ncbi:MAG: DUF3373 family protein, partial [Desulfurivibrionaceae bacterium]